jgi:hypothetical protein
MTMIVPDFWAEGLARAQAKGKPLTVRRFGWSTSSQQDAQRMADERAQAALARVLAGDHEPRRDRKVPYNGADGLPIREEVVSRHGDEVVTRNSYGALCLNTPRVLVADVDCPPASVPFGVALWIALWAVLMAVATLLWPSELDALVLLGMVVASLVIASLGCAVASRVRRRRQARSEQQGGGAKGVAREQVEAFAAAHPDWGLRMYETPAGLRLLATHRSFDPGELAVAQFFGAVQADTLYVAMCRNQHCFRARLTAKPWRMGIPHHMKPRPGVWPVAPESRFQRDAWLAEYDARAEGFAACRFEKALGSPIVAPEVAAVVALHDRQSRALRTELPLA